MSIEDAVKSIVPFVPHVQKYAEIAIEKRRQNTHLARDESAAIYLYTMSNDFYPRLNEALRFQNRDALKAWFPFLKLFIAALKKLPSRPATVWRGVGENVAPYFVEAFEHIWWSVNSCSSQINVAECFAGENGSLFCINTIYGKDVTAYSANQGEEEVVLMPGTRLCVQSTSIHHNGFFLVHLNECTAVPAGQHVMLSYNSKAQEIVAKIRDILQSGHILVWFDEQVDMKENNMYDSLAKGVGNAAVVCCFLTSDYEKSQICKLELQYAHKRRKPIIPCVLNDTQLWKTSSWLKSIIENLKCIDIHDTSESNVQLKAIELIHRINEQPFVSQYPTSQPVNQPTYLFEWMKYNYICNSRIERFINPSISYPIEQSYINLAIVETKEQQEKEKKLRDIQKINAVMHTFEEIYGSKIPTDVKDIFKTCKDQVRKVLVFGRAGIGKSTFCRYVAYQWATGAIWSEYELVVLVPLRSLIKQGYQANIDYYLVDILKKQYFSNLRLSAEEEKLLEEQIRTKQILWLLDGYDEIVQNTSAHLYCLVDNLLKTPHHIVTSRPYMNTLPYPVQMEITGFTDENIPNYIKQFFDQLQNELQNSSIEHDRLLSVLQLNPRIWGIAHIPINLELICSVWSNTDWSETATITMTILYDKLTEWIFRRYLEKQRRMSTDQINSLDTAEVYQYCQNELAFLASLAVHGMKTNTILLGTDLLEKAKSESKCSFIDHPHLLNVGILKSFNQNGTGTRIEAQKDFYFVHLSFQEYFAARYLANALGSRTPDTAIDFIQKQKYNQRFRLVFNFASGLLVQSGEEQTINKFWNTILGEPLDVVGIQHIDLLITCLDQVGYNRTFAHRNLVMDTIIRWIERAFQIGTYICSDYLKRTLPLCTNVSNDSNVQDILIKLLQAEKAATITEFLFFISYLQLTTPTRHLVDTIMKLLEHTYSDVRRSACKALGEVGKKAATNEVINGLVSALGDDNWNVRRSACEALDKIGEKAATTEVINRLVSAIGDKDSKVKRRSACEALGEMGKKAATTEVINRLVSALGDDDWDVRRSACKALGEMGKKAATTEVINLLVSALGNENAYTRSRACEALGAIGEKAATTEVINRLVSALGDEDADVRIWACEALGAMREKAATTEVINRLVIALGDENAYARIRVCMALGKITKKAATAEVINRLVIALGDENAYARSRACEALGAMREKAATSEVINRLVSALGDKDSQVRRSACEALGKMGKKAATTEVINRIVSALSDENAYARSRACMALGKIGEKAATAEVINRLVIALGDENAYTRSRACEALGAMGEKAATTEVINRIVSALGDKDSQVRRSACEALVKMGKKAATSKVINRHVIALGDENAYARSRACEALGAVGGKAATSEVINQLASALAEKDSKVRRSACEALDESDGKEATAKLIHRVLRALQRVSVEGKFYSEDIIRYVLSLLSGATMCRDKESALAAAVSLGKSYRELRSVASQTLLEAYIDMADPMWLRAVVWAFLFNGSAVTVSENTIWVYDREEIIKIPLTNQELLDKLQKAFVDM